MIKNNLELIISIFIVTISLAVIVLLVVPAYLSIRNLTPQLSDAGSTLQSLLKNPIKQSDLSEAEKIIAALNLDITTMKEFYASKDNKLELFFDEKINMTQQDFGARFFDEMNKLSDKIRDNSKEDPSLLFATIKQTEQKDQPKELIQKRYWIREKVMLAVSKVKIRKVVDELWTSPRLSSSQSQSISTLRSTYPKQFKSMEEETRFEQLTFIKPIYYFLHIEITPVELFKLLVNLADSKIGRDISLECSGIYIDNLKLDQSTQGYKDMFKKVEVSEKDVGKWDRIKIEKINSDFQAPPLDVVLIFRILDIDQQLMSESSKTKSGGNRQKPRKQ